MEGGDNNNVSPSSTPPIVVNESLVEEACKYLCKIVPPLVDGDATLFQSQLNSGDSLSKLRKFISDTKLPVFLIQKHIQDDDKETYTFDVEVRFGGEKTTSLVILKRVPESSLEPNKSISSQVQVINLGEGSPFDTLHNYIHNSVAPFIRSFTAKSSSKQSEKDVKSGIGAVNQKIAELELSLYNCKQQVQIPEVSLAIHPDIKALVQKCQAAGRTVKVEDLGEVSQEFLNSLQAGVSHWVKDIQKVTKLKSIEEFTPDSSTSQEINFWSQLEVALQNINEQLKTPEAEITLATLKQGKRFLATASFDTDTIGLKKAMERVNNYKTLTKDFPVTQLLTATDVESVSQAIMHIFSYLKKSKNSYYPIERYLLLLEAVGKDMCNKVLQILKQRQLMLIDYVEFEKVTSSFRALFTLWDDQFGQFRENLRDIARKRGSDRVPLLVNVDNRRLQDRVLKLRKFRRQHDELKNVISTVLPQQQTSTSNSANSSKSGEINAIKEINEAYDEVKDIDVLLLTQEGEDIWTNAQKRYNSRIDRVESYITTKLRDRLAIAKNANEMFRVFSKFNVLFFRPRIRLAIQEYQTQLIQRVKEDIKGLHEKFKMQYSNSEAFHMSNLRDLPPVSGAIIWARQIERQLDTYMRRVEDVLGESWESDAEGQKLKAESDQFRSKLNTDHIYNKWAQDTLSRSFEVTGKILTVVKKGNKMSLDINFDSHIIMLFKEVRNLQWLGFRVPLNISFISTNAKQIYPFAVSLKETLRTYTQTCGKITAEVSPLVASYKRDVQLLINEGFKLKWEALPQLDPYVRKLSSSVNIFRDKVDDLLVKYTQISKLLDQIKLAPFKQESFIEIITSIQKLVDEFNLANYSNLSLWVNQLDALVEGALTERLKDAIDSWIVLIEGREVEKESIGGAAGKGRLVYASRNRVRPADEQGSASTHHTDPSTIKPTLESSVHEIVIRNQILYLDPPLEFARVNWISQLHRWLNIVCDLPRIQASRYDESISHRGELDSRLKKTFRDMLTKLPKETLETAYQTIQSKLDEVQRYVQIWLQYQALWDMESSFVYAKLGDDLNRWQQLLSQIKKSRSTFDNSSTQKEFGPLVIDYGQVQSSVNNKYDFWHKDILSHFGSKLVENMRKFYNTISDSRTELEKLSAETTSTEEAVAFIIQIQDMKKRLTSWEADLKYFRSGQDLLHRQRFQFPNDWLECDMVEQEWNAFNDILNRKNSSMSEAIPQLQAKILAESKSIGDRIKEFIDSWTTSKPLQGSIKHSAALETIKIFEGRLVRLREENERLRKAKVALDLIDQGPSGDEDRLLPVEEEMQDLKAVWTELAATWLEIDNLRETSWSAVVPRKVRKSLEDTLQKLKNLPNRIRTYNAFDHAQTTMKSLLKANAIITDLHSEAIKERHWKMLKKRLNTNWILTELTLGHIWDSDLVRNEGVYREVITAAQGEIALEEFLKSVREYWVALELDLVNYQRKCKLIRGWDDLFSKLAEHLNSISAMKMSPFYKVFEEEASSWDDKLNRVRSLLDVWIDVQRRWVYLEGIFSGSGDINQLLPAESSRFKSINAEFINLMKKVSQNPLVLEVLNIERIQFTMERLADLLSKIQKALGEYLERQRAAFARFYFVGDEDLLEIIGNSKDIVKIQKHFRKMFAGLANLILDDEKVTILGMSSGEGEVVMFKKPVSIANGPKIHEWLTAVETEMRTTLATLLDESLKQYQTITPTDMVPFNSWVNQYPTQLVILTSQIVWSQTVDRLLGEGGNNNGGQLDLLEKQVQTILGNMADAVLEDLQPQIRKKYEHLITELVHQRDVVRQLVKNRVSSNKDFDWLYNMRFYYDNSQENILHKLNIHMANAVFYYGYEYLGIGERLVQTPLTDRCYLTLTQALESRMGGNPFGPAGTGKTETVKALGNQLGRFVLVFCCDEGFDFQAMSRIFVGLCQCGAWGCFDEFNRLEERILSAVSQQIQTIQVALKEKAKEVELIGKTVKIHPDMGIFVTMNPGYAGRSNLPDNLKQLFRSMAMIRPDREMIAQVMLYSQGFKTAEVLAGKIVPLFKLCQEQLSAQSHYDFGLRALKSVLVSAGGLKRKMQPPARTAEMVDFETIYSKYEIGVLLSSITDTMIPKLVADDIPLIQSLLLDVFPGSEIPTINIAGLREQIKKSCTARHLVDRTEWVEKILQLHQIQNINHGLMMVGPSGSGKTAAWNVYLESIEAIDHVKSEAHVLDPKAITKDQLFGSLDSTTREWTDGLFTATLRRIIDNVRGESSKRHWIIFDGDVDPEWVENLNSLLDDNKLFTLPNGERLALPNNVRIVFEVQDLKYATLATISRCGMVWFSEETLTTQMIFENYLKTLDHEPFDEAEREQQRRNEQQQQGGSTVAPLITPGLRVQKECVAIISQYFEPGALVHKVLEDAAQRPHIMDFTRLRVLNSFFSLLNRSIQNIVEYNSLHSDFPMSAENTNTYVTNRLLYSLMWGLGGSMGLQERENFSKYIQTIAITPVPANTIPLLDYAVNVEDAQWSLWKNKVPTVEVETHKVASPDVVIPTVDTTRHVDVLHAWLSEHRPLLLCGPPGSGKTMTLTSTLRAFPDFEVISLNFSSATTPELILKTFDHHCEYKRTPQGDTVLRPVAMGKWLVVFCDEINLPSTDKYGTQRVITFIRQLVEKGGFWRTSDHTWIRLEKIQFVGACNPPTDAGRVPLSHRFLRHAPILLVDFPSASSLTQIYGTFNRSLIKLLPNLRSYADALTDAMVEFYSASQKRFTPDMQAHYIYSPRELSRWVRALLEAIQTMEGCTIDGLVRLWAHEGLRLFQDRLVEVEERDWTDKMIDEVALKYFPNIGSDTLKRPILYSNWLSKDYVPVERAELREYVKARLKVFYEEELDVPLVLFNEVLDHILRIDRVFRQPQGHALLIGVSGGGKSVLSRFVAWMNGLSIYTIKVNNNYKATDFDDDLRMLLKRAGCKEEKICFIFDESNVLESSFLERMNTLLAGGEVPGLFEGEEYTALMHQCKETATRNGLIMDTEEELYKYFTGQVRRNLHVVFTMNPASPDFHNRSATSPALFNRCVLDWFGEWSPQALFQVGSEFTRNLDLENPSYQPTAEFIAECEANEMVALPPSHRDAVVSSLVYIHQTIGEANARLLRKQGRQNYVTPRHYLDFINQVVLLINEKREQLEEEQLHLNIGLKKLRDTEQQVKDLQVSLAQKKNELEVKNEQANNKLKQMVADQQIAEKKQKEALELQSQLDIRNQEIQVQKVKAYADLEKAEPAILEAQESVSTIKKKHLDEIKALPKPPQPVKLAMEAVCLMLTGKKLDWADIRRKIMEPTFISSIVDYDTKKQLTSKIRDMVKKEYLEDPNFNYEAVNRASKACGPLVKWVTAQAIFSEILDRVKPLREEVEQLENAANELKAKQDEIVKTIETLNESIATYKDEYATLIRDTESIKAEMTKVKNKVDRSIALIDNLSSERGRWEVQSENFQTQMSTVVGDVVLASAFLAYIGFFDQHFRADLMHKWMNRLESVGIKFKPELSVPDFLARPEERLQWHANSLPADDLCIENAIMLKRFNRYPLVIDPSGQAMEFLMNQYADKKINKTSFLDASFMKNLESALRFGCPLLVQDVENIDPVLNPVLNKEIRKKGGRILIRLGDQDVDFSPSFMIFLFTRDPTAHFTPDLCSRVTFVNFTVTPSSLQSQCLHETLKTERPDTHKKRSDLLKIQGEFKVKLRTLEKSLLSALSQAQGNILDDDSIIGTLESLKREAAEIAVKVEETDVVMQEISAVSAIYNPMALACSRVYFAMEQLAQFHLYQFSLRFFLDLFYVLLNANPNLDGVKDPNDRLNILQRDIFTLAFNRVSRTLLNDDKITFALQLANIALKGKVDEIDEQEWDYLLKGGDNIATIKETLPQLSSIVDSQNKQKWIVTLRSLQSFGARFVEHIQQNSSEWKPFFDSASANSFTIPESWLTTQQQLVSPKKTDITVNFRKILLMKAFHSDRILLATHQFVSSVFGEHFLQVQSNDMAQIVEKESKAVAPLLLCSVPGYDASPIVDDLAVELRKPYKSLAIGSPEGFELAEKSIFAATKNGSWVLLKNIHLAPQWLVQLEKKLHSLTPHPNFRLFMTSEIHPNLPANLLRMSHIFSYENPPGVKANLLHTFGNIPAARMDRQPVERSRIYFMLAWFHAIIQERLRYIPIGWTKIFEFNDADLRGALDAIDYWVDLYSKGRSNIDPDKIPWIALRTILGQTIYGGRVDNEFDMRLLNSFLEQLFTPSSFNPDFTLVESLGINIPEGTTRAHFLKWIDTLPDLSTPVWLGLQDNAESLLLSNKAKKMINDLQKMQSSDEDPESEDSKADDKEDKSKIKMRQTVSEWIKVMPKPLKALKRTAQNIKDPLFRCFEREITTGIKLIKKITNDLNTITELLDGNIKQTNYLRSLTGSIAKGVVPREWKWYSCPDSVSLSIWMSDFFKRMQQLNEISECTDFKSVQVWLGGLLNPEAYITATRQSAAQLNGWSLENLKLHINSLGGTSDNGFAVKGLSLEGAAWKNEVLAPTHELSTPITTTTLTWKDKDDPIFKENQEGKLNVPVYLNDTRTELLFSIDLPFQSGTTKQSWYQRSVSISSWKVDF